MLSSKDIIKELGRNIAIYPFKKLNIKGSSINFTASDMAWSVETKKTIVSDDKTVITIPPHDTGLIETNEALGVSLRIGGTYHSRVTIASKGLGHVGTRLNPGWVGRSLIALHNGSDKPISINVDDSIATICFYYLKSKSIVGETSEPARKDILQEYDLSSDERDAIYGVDYDQDFELLKIKMIKDSEYIKHKKNRTKLRRYITISISILVVLAGLVSWLLLTNKSSNLFDILSCTLTGFFSILGVIIGVGIGKKYIK